MALDDWDDESIAWAYSDRAIETRFVRKDNQTWPVLEVKRRPQCTQKHCLLFLVRLW